MGLTIIRKFEISRAGKRFITFFLVCSALVFLMGFWLLFSSLPQIVEYGFDEVSSNTRFHLVGGIAFIVLDIFALSELPVMKGRFICVCKEKVFGDAGNGHKPKPVDLLIEEITSAHGHENGSIVIHSVKGDFAFNYIEDAVECARIINQLKKELHN